jgi:LysR family cys regulon transcriptional activator
MKLRQLQYICEVARRGLNVSNVAEILHTAQPGISTQIRLLEQELKVKIFERNGKRLVAITQPGKVIIQRAERVLREVEHIKQISHEFTQEDSGTLSIATTHTQARYALPQTIKAFKEKYPDVRLRIHQGDPEQIAEMVIGGVADLGIASETAPMHKLLVTLPCHEWDFCVVTPPDHALLKGALTLERLVEYPLITYDYSFSGRSLINKAFGDQGLMTNMALTAMDSDVIKTYVELGLGVGILAKMAYDEKRDAGLKAIDAGHLFEKNVTHIGIHKSKYLRGYMYAFIELFSPHLKRKVIDEAVHVE